LALADPKHKVVCVEKRRAEPCGGLVIVRLHNPDLLLHIRPTFKSSYNRNIE
jgi:hypothetical protein